MLLSLLLTLAGCENKQAPLGGMSDAERQALEEPFPPSAIVEVARSKSPDGVLESVIVTRATDATVATPTEVYLVPKGGEVKGEPFFRADHVSGISVSWRSDSNLLVQATEARPFRQEATARVILKKGTRTVALVYGIDKLDPSGM